MRTIDQIISESVEQHIQTCVDRVSAGFKVVEVEVPLEHSSKVFTLLSNEISYGVRMCGWVFGVFSQGFVRFHRFLFVFAYILAGLGRFS